MLIAAPFTAHAFISLFSSMLTQDNESEVSSYVDNSQTLALLSPETTESYLRAYGGGDVTVSDNALVATGVASNTDTAGEPAGNSLYVVREGDSLSVISSLFNVSPETIRLANNIRSGGTIQPGQMLEIPPTDGVPYTVKRGDTVSSIAKAHSVTTDDIMASNFIFDETSLKAGEKIFIPGGKVSAPKASTPKVQPKSTAPKTHIASDYYIYPLVKRVARSQGYHGRWRGVDFAAPMNTGIVASADGVVRMVNRYGWGGGYGVYVVIAHDNGSQTLYAHNTSVTVNVGQRVKQGEIIAYSGNTGRSTGPHLHFEIRNGRDVPPNW